MALTPDTDQTRSDKMAQRDAAEQDVLLREVDEAVRQDQLAMAVKRYGWTAAGVAALGLAAFGGVLFWQSQQDRKLGENSELLVTSLDKLEAGQASRADEELAPVAAGEGGSAIVAQLTRAGIALQDGRPKDAVKLYDAIAANADAPQPYRDLANIRSVSAQFDQMQPQQVVDRLKPLAVPGNPWFGSAGELVAMAYLKQDKKDLAGPLLAAIAKDEKVPQSLRSRTRQMAGLLGYDAVVDVDATLSEMRKEGGAAAPAN
ncbi:MAG: hypothetical protein RLZZ08_1538 [Pseudomonadota bacterium]